MGSLDLTWALYQHNMNKIIIIGLVLAIFAAFIVSDVGGFPLDKKAENVANALMYLNQLDQLYSNQIRPRFGKRGNYMMSNPAQHYYEDMVGMRINNADILE